MITVAEYIARTLADQGVQHLFMVVGGGAMFLNDALGNQPGIQPVFNHHEQACAMAAEAYARLSGRIGVINVTTGPGGINALNGVFGAWTDSVPMLVISGQVKRETCMATYAGCGLRQLGDQEADLVSLAKPITKYAVLVTDPADIRRHLERALHEATSGRPGPCWIDVPVDVQSAAVEPATLTPDTPPATTRQAASLAPQCEAVLERLKRAERPVLMAGTGIRAAGVVDDFRRLYRRLEIPVVTAWTHDLIASDDPLFCGRPGSIGTRAGNFTVQNADLLLVLGSRLNIRQVSYNWASFARHAYRIQVDVDAAELRKPTVRPHLAIHADLRDFMPAMLTTVDAGGYRPARYQAWLTWCRERSVRYPTLAVADREPTAGINPYRFVERLFSKLGPEDVVACGDGTACVATFQVAPLQEGQRLFSNSGCASMGYGLPAAIGAYYGALRVRGAVSRIICLDGDGSIMMNLQELETVAHNQLPLKIFVLNNRGYLSLRITQQNFFGRLTGEGPSSGLGFPDFRKLGEALGIPSRCVGPDRLDEELDAVLASPGPALCDVQLDPAQVFEPRLSSRQRADGRIVTVPLEDMAPPLDRTELRQNLLFEPEE